MSSQAQKVARFRALHERPGAFVIPNPWDIGTAKLLAAAGFEALATTSLGFANTLGRVDGAGAVTRDEVIAHCRLLAEATDLPLNADLENGYADASIEDATGDDQNPIYDFRFAVERVAAAVAAAHQRPVPILLTARAENYLHGRPDLEDTIKRLQAFAEAGADVLYAPGLRDLATIRQVAASVPRPINVVMSAADPTLTLASLAEAGVKRVSIGGALSRLALASVMKAAREMREGGFTWVRETMPTRELKAIFAE